MAMIGDRHGFRSTIDHQHELVVLRRALERSRGPGRFASRPACLTEMTEMYPQGDSGPVTIFRTNDPGLLAVAQSLLQAADIEFFVVGQVVSGLYPGGAAGPYVVPAICVNVDDVETARELLKELT